MNYTVKVEGITFECEVEWDYPDRKRLDSVAVFLPDSDVELSMVLSQQALQEIDEQIYKEGYPEPDYEPEDL